MNVFKKIAKKVGNSLLHFAVNEDRAVASLAGAPEDWTISGETGKHDNVPVLHQLGDVLDAIQPGHIQGAEAHDAAVQAADDKITAEQRKTGLTE
jgi:SpoU rRNA methylase family enzyme